jgi:hypothetical protein
MLQPINDINLESELWADHNPLDGSLIGGAMPKEYILMTAVPGAPRGILLGVNGAAWATMEAYCLPRPNFVTKGFGVTTETFTLTIDHLGAAQIREFDLIRIIRLADGTVWHFDGSIQIVIATGMIQVDSAPPALPKLPTWVDTGVTIPASALTPDVPHLIAITHKSDPVAKTHSVISISVDGVVYAIPAAFQNLPATPSNWSVVDVDYIQAQLTVLGTGGAAAELLSAISLQHRTAV